MVLGWVSLGRLVILVLHLSSAPYIFLINQIGAYLDKLFFKNHNNLNFNREASSPFSPGLPSFFVDGLLTKGPKHAIYLHKHMYILTVNINSIP